jgi:hypothetical protein
MRAKNLSILLKHGDLLNQTEVNIRCKISPTLRRFAGLQKVCGENRKNKLWIRNHAASPGEDPGRESALSRTFGRRRYPARAHTRSS